MWHTVHGKHFQLFCWILANRSDQHLTCGALNMWNSLTIVYSKSNHRSRTKDDTLPCSVGLPANSVWPLIQQSYVLHVHRDWLGACKPRTAYTHTWKQFSSTAKLKDNNIITSSVYDPKIKFHVGKWSSAHFVHRKDLNCSPIKKNKKK